MYQHRLLALPCSAGEKSLLAALDYLKNQEGYDLVSMDIVPYRIASDPQEVQEATQSTLTAHLKGCISLTPQTEPVPAWFMVLRRVVPGSEPKKADAEAAEPTAAERFLTTFPIQGRELH